MTKNPESPKHHRVVYESPDGGDTVFVRDFGSEQRQMIKDGPLHQRLLRSQLWRDILTDSETDPVLRDMLDRVEIYHHLKNTLP